MIVLKIVPMLIGGIVVVQIIGLLWILAGVVMEQFNGHPE